MKFKILKYLSKFGLLKRKLGWKTWTKVKRIYYWDGEEVNEDRYQSFVKQTIWIGFIKFNKKLFFEHVPSFAWIQHNTLGFSDWKSSFPSVCFKYNKI